jgi:hypothetical protein
VKTKGTGEYRHPAKLDEDCSELKKKNGSFMKEKLNYH